MLLALLSGQRCQTLHALDINGMQLDSDKCIFTIRTLLKTFRVGHHLTPIKLLAFKHDPAFCIVTHLERYIDRTRTLRGNQAHILISFQKPYKAVSADTVSRWLKKAFELAGINTITYVWSSQHSFSLDIGSQSYGYLN